MTYTSSKSDRMFAVHLLTTTAILASLALPALADAPTPDDGQATEIVVHGKKVQISPTLKAATTTTVLTSSEMARKPDQNVVDALSRTSGISVMKTDSVSPADGNHNGLDGAARGESSHVAIRGMSGSYNVTLLNGANAAQGLPYSRDLSLDLLPPSGLKQIVVSKTSTADMDGDAIGGTLDFQTPSAFDFKDGQSRIYAKAGVSELAQNYGVASGSGMVQFETAKRFGVNKAFGLYATAYYGKRNFASTMEDYQAGQWEFAVATDEQGSSPDGFYKPDNLLLTSLNAQFSKGQQTRYGGALSLDWRGDTTSLYLRATDAHSKIDQEVYQKGIQADGYSAATQRPDGLYQNAENDAEYHYWFETSPERSQLSSLVAGGNTNLGKLTADYSLFYSYATDAAPDHAEITYQTSGDNDLNGPFQLSYRDNYPIPLLSAAQLSRLNTNSLFVYSDDSGEYTSSFSKATKSGARFDLTYTLDSSLIRDVKFGGKYVKSERSSYSRDYSNLNFVPSGTTLANSTLISGSVIADKTYYPYILPTGNGSQLTALTAAAAQKVTLSDDDYNGNTLSGWESVASAYVLSHINYNQIEIQPGLRYEQTEIRNLFWTKADTGSHFDTSQTKYSFLLPSVHVNYRPTDSQVIRAAIWSSYTRPAFFQLAGGRQVSVSKGVTTITEGNPDLKAITALNYDLSAEFALPTSRFVVSTYYKDMDHYMYDRGRDLRARGNTTAGTTIINRPSNGGKASLLGIELEGDYRFTQLSGLMSGLSVSGNVTVQTSSVHLLDPGTDDKMPMAGAPNLMYNASLDYSHGPLDATLSYHFNGRTIVKYRFGDYGGRTMNEWSRATQTLDASLGYELRPNLKLTAAVTNLLNSYSYYRTVGQSTQTVPQIVRSGRQALVSVSYDF